MLIMMYFSIILLARSKFTEKNGLNIMYVIKLSGVAPNKTSASFSIVFLKCSDIIEEHH